MTRPDLPLYVVESPDGDDLLGCEQEGIESARLAARTLVVDDGVPEAHVRAVGERFALERFKLDEWGNLLISSSDLARGRR